MTLGCLHESSYGDFGAQLLAKIGGRRVPLSGSWDLTERCNLACTHCYINRPPGDGEAASRELTEGQIASVLEQLVAEGCLWLLFTGGEPLLRPDFLAIYKRAKRLGLLITLFTNGTLLTPAVADELAEWRPHRIEVTLYGARPEIYERMTRIPGSFARCMRGIELLTERRLPVALKSTISSVNRGDLAEMKALAEERGVGFRYDSLLTPRLDGSASNLHARLDAEEVVQLDRSDPDRIQEWQRVLEVGGRDFRKGDTVYFCGAGNSSFHMDAYGNLSTCATARRPSWPVVQGTFRESWHGFLAETRQTKRAQDSACRTCDVGGLCDQCPGWSQLVCGDNESAPEFVCRVGRLRARLLSTGISS